MMIDGEAIAEQIINKLKNRPPPKKFLAAFLVGNDSASLSFLKQKQKTARELGVDLRLYKFPETVGNDELRREVLKIAKHRTCGGVIVQLPLPEHLNQHYVLNVIPREKDIDVLGERALGAFYVGRNPVLPPAVATLNEVLLTLGYALSSSKVAIVGLGFLVGKPIVTWLQGRCKEILLFDEGSDFLLLREADIVVTGVGRAGVIKPDMLRGEAVVVDFGYDSRGAQNAKHKAGRLGDFDAAALGDTYLAISYTPTPHGTGPILVAKLLENFYALNS